MSSENGHPPREQLTAFAAGQLGDDDQVAVASHVEDCDVCCQALREIPDDVYVEKLRAAYSPTPGGTPVTLPPAETLPRELLEHPKYKVGRFLGRGGMGVVYQAEHRLMGRQVALKIIHRELMSNPRVVDRFRQEVQAAGRLLHPNIVAAHDAEQAGDAHFLVMEYVDGVSLGKLVARKGPLEVATACNFIRQAARGLEHAFEAGMVHRDIKPHNLMLTKKGQIKILDFGLARLASESGSELGLPEGQAGPGLTRLGDIMGTPDYMSPEQLVNSSQADIRADLYSLGCTLFFLLTGESPFWKDSARVVLLSKKYRPPRAITDLRHDLPAGLVAVINTLLAKDPDKRYQTPAEVVQAVTPFVKPMPTRLTPPAPKPAPPPPPESPKNDLIGQCPFCKTRVRLPEKTGGGRCPKCGCAFTADEARNA